MSEILCFLGVCSGVRFVVRPVRIVLQSHPPVTAFQSGKSLKVLSEVLPRVLRDFGVLRGVLLRELREIGVLQEMLPSEAPPISLSTLGTTPISRSTLLGTLPRALSRISHFGISVAGGWDCKYCSWRRCL